MDDWDVFFDPADFGVTARWETQEGEMVDVDGIFEASREVALSGNTGGVSAILPVFSVALSAVPPSASQGDDLELDSVNYLVADIQPDGSGMARIILERI